MDPAGPPGSSPGSLPAAPGLYALQLALPQQRELRVGRLGARVFEAGAYLYVGSACGPGGVRGRVGRHFRTMSSRSAHWHIDRLLAVGHAEGAWWDLRPVEKECDWAALLARSASRRPALFGASDCGCAGHLLYFPTSRAAAAAVRQLGEDLGHQAEWAAAQDIDARISRLDERRRAWTA